MTKRALYEVSTLLHQNPRKDKPPSGFPMPFGGQGFRPPGAPMTNVLPPGNPMWSNRAPSHSMPPMPRMEGYGNRSSEFAPGGFNGVPPGHGGEALAEFSMKILCSPGKIGGVIGKGGFNVKQLQLETGASIHVQEASTDSEERVIHVSAFEVCRFVIHNHFSTFNFYSYWLRSVMCMNSLMCINYLFMHMDYMLPIC